MNEIKDETQVQIHTETPTTSAPAPVKAAKLPSTKNTQKKPAPKTKPKKAVSTQAQGGPPLKNLSFDKMNKAEKKIVKAIFKGDHKAFTIKEIMKATGLKNSPVRNNLRRPVRGGWLERAVVKTDDQKKVRSAYRLTEQARKRGI